MKALLLATALAGAPAEAYTSAWITPFDGFDPEDLACFDAVNVFALSFDARHEVRVASPELLRHALAVRPRGARVVPTIVNDVEGGELKSQAVLRHWLGDEERLKRHAERLADAVEPYDGIELDYEKIPEPLWGPFVRLVEELARRLRPLGKTVEVVVEASPLHRGGGRIARTHWPALAAAADRVKVMCYYERGDFSDRPGPGASQAWVEQTAKKILEVLPAGKAALAFSLAATDYELPWPKLRQRRKVKRLHFKQAAALRERTAAALEWDDAFGSPLFRYREGGRRHEVWLEDEKTLARKVDAARALGLGAAVWYLGLRRPDLRGASLCPSR